ncbi:hypothetical protein CEXT_101681 [Caerostris extrusa]|uniref:Uncharacterized protein n=1 Tax=Caerostris extrusa TaxID=172846 RepID=A0AAV4NCM0_CAEEX|nr:hypothetical protein CEXT_101681 [Caerostris extrusa]
MEVKICNSKRIGRMGRSCLFDNCFDANFVAILDRKMLLKNIPRPPLELKGIGICPNHTVACKSNKSAKPLQEKLCLGQ